MVERFTAYLRMIKFSHSVFALPFAFTSAIIAAGGIPELRKILWITVAMVSGRSAAMGMNRLIDRRIDAENPRTRDREIPAGKVSVREAAVFVVISSLIFIFSAFMLNRLCLILSPVALAVFFIYPYTKRFTHLSHIFLGLAISGATAGAWIAVEGRMDPRILILAGSVVFWLAGFDILYALQDMDFDRKAGLHSIPGRYGPGKSLLLSRLFHLMTWILLALTGLVFELGYIYSGGLLLVGMLLLYEHRLVKEDDFSRLDTAFFNMNGYISLTIFFATLFDHLVSR